DSQRNVDRGTVWRRHNSRVGSTETTTNQTDLYGEFDLAGMKHRFSVGAEFSHEKADRSSYVVDTTSGLPTGTPRNCTALVGAASNYNCTSLANPNPNVPWNGSIARSPYGTETKSRTRAIYLFDTLELTRSGWSTPGCATTTSKRTSPPRRRTARRAPATPASS